MGYKPPTVKIIIKRKAGDRTAQCGALGRDTHTHTHASRRSLCFEILGDEFLDDLSDWPRPYVSVIQDYF